MILKNIRHLIVKNKLLFIAIALFAFCGIYNSSFYSRLNINGMFLSVSYMSMLAIGMTFVILTGGIDLSVGAIAGLSSVILAYGMKNWYVVNDAWTLILCLVLALVISLVIGLVNGFLVSALKLPPLIVTLSMTWVVTGIANTLVKGTPLAISISTLKIFLKYKIAHVIPIMFVITFLAIIIFSYIFSKLRFGRQLYAVGSSQYAAFSSGMNVRFVYLYAYALSGVMSGIAGIFIAANLNSGYPNAATGYELYTIAAVVMGGVSLNGGEGKLINAFYGVVILQLLKKLVVFTGLSKISGFLEGIIVGTILVVVLVFNSLKEKDNQYE